MIDALPSEPSKDSVAARNPHGRLIAGAVAALIIVAGAFVWRIVASPPPATVRQTVSAAPPVRNPVLDELVATTKALEDSQQQAIDQLQVVQQLLASQRAETKKSSDEVAALSDKLEALQQSFASISPPSPEEADAAQRGKSKPTAARSRRKEHRHVSVKPGAAATRH